MDGHVYWDLVQPFKGIVFKSGTLWAIITINFGGTVWMH